MVLTGIAQRGAERIAFIENRLTGETVRVSTGGAVGNGKLAAITFSGIDYVSGGRVTKVEVGRSLGGTFPASAPVATATTTRPAAAPATPAATPAAAPAQSGPRTSPSVPLSSRASILERLRRRREQELKK
jgi:hypothetical protein